MHRWLLAFSLAAAVFAQESPPPYDFVVLVDNSISMADRKGSVVSAVRELLNSSFARQIQTGDRVRLWTCQPHLDEAPERAPAFAWDAEDLTYLSAKAVEQVREAKFQRGTHLGPALAELAALAPESQVLLAVIYTDGQEPLTGIPFSAEINRELPKLRRESARLKRPLQIAVAARGGVWTDWRASAGADPRFLCRLPAHPKPEPLPEVKVAAEPAVPPIEKRTIAPEPENPSVFNYPPGTKIFATVAEPPAQPPALSAAIELSPLKGDATNEVAVGGSIDEIARSNTPTRAAAITNLLPLPVPAAPLNEPLKFIAPAPLHRPGSASEISAEIAPEFPFPAVLAAGGGVLFLGFGLMLLNRSRPPDPKQTFISQSLAK